MSRETHMARAHRSHNNFKIGSRDMAFHGNGLIPVFSENNKNKSHMPSWEKRFRKWENKDKVK